MNREKKNNSRRNSVDEMFKSKLNHIIEENYTDENFGVKDLTRLLNLNRSQVHRKIKEYFNKSTSQFIREYRLQKALILLQTENLTASEVAYTVGFGSPAYFNKSFHELFGFTPGEAKFHNVVTTDVNTQRAPELQKGNFLKFGLTKISIIGFVLVLIILFFSYELFLSESSFKNIKKENSIAVLPFKNLSNDADNQYFADGVMDDVLNHLSLINGFKVISRTTMDQYRNTNKTIPVIADELNVEYILESSLQKQGDSIRIISQLIDAESDSHIWSGDFRHEFFNIFVIESEIARQIAKSLDTELNSEEEERISKAPTGNLDAYDLYLNGKFAFNSNKDTDLVEYANNLKQCLKIDPDFALAYAALARIKIQRMRAGHIKISKKEIEEAKEYALKSIELDDNARAHASLGWLLYSFEWDWEHAEKEFKRAIQMNPNYEGGHVYLSMLLFDVKGDVVRARKHLDKAMYLSPYGYFPRMVNSYLNFKEKEYDQSIADSQILVSINEQNNYSYWNTFRNLAAKNMNDKAVEALVSGWKTIDEMADLSEQIKNAYKEDGLDGVYHELINDLTKEHSIQKPFMVANYYALLNDRERAIEWLEKAYDLKDSGLISLKYHIDFEDLRADPRVQSILKRMNLISV